MVEARGCVADGGRVAWCQGVVVRGGDVSGVEGAACEVGGGGGAVCGGADCKGEVVDVSVGDVEVVFGGDGDEGGAVGEEHVVMVRFDGDWTCTCRHGLSWWRGETATVAFAILRGTGGKVD